MNLFDLNTAQPRKTYRDDNGYLRFKDSDKLVHRWVAYKKIGRRLRSEEVVHHINMVKTDNNPSNLYVCSDQREHEKIHGIDNYRQSDLNLEDFTEFVGFMFRLFIIIADLILRLVWMIIKFICKNLYKIIKLLIDYFLHYFINAKKIKMITIKNNQCFTKTSIETDAELLKKSL